MYIIPSPYNFDSVWLVSCVYNLGRYVWISRNVLAEMEQNIPVPKVVNDKPHFCPLRIFCHVSIRLIGHTKNNMAVHSKHI